MARIRNLAILATIGIASYIGGYINHTHAEEIKPAAVQSAEKNKKKQVIIVPAIHGMPEEVVDNASREEQTGLKVKRESKSRKQIRYREMLNLLESLLSEYPEGILCVEGEAYGKFSEKPEMLKAVKKLREDKNPEIYHYNHSQLLEMGLKPLDVLMLNNPKRIERIYGIEDPDLLERVLEMKPNQFISERGLVYERNRASADNIRKALESSKAYIAIVVVGERHLLGRETLQSYLKKQRLEIEIKGDVKKYEYEEAVQVADIKKTDKTAYILPIRHFSAKEIIENAPPEEQKTIREEDARSKDEIVKHQKQVLKKLESLVSAYPNAIICFESWEYGKVSEVIDKDPRLIAKTRELKEAKERWTKEEANKFYDFQIEQGKNIVAVIMGKYPEEIKRMYGIDGGSLYLTKKWGKVTPKMLEDREVVIYEANQVMAKNVEKALRDSNADTAIIITGKGHAREEERSMQDYLGKSGIKTKVEKFE